MTCGKALWDEMDFCCWCRLLKITTWRIFEICQRRVQTFFFWVIVRKIIVLISSLVHILIVKSSINYRTFLNLHSLYHMNRLQLKEVLVWTILEENLQQKLLISQRVVYNNTTMKHASSLHECTIPNSYILKRKSKFTCQIVQFLEKQKKASENADKSKKGSLTLD